MERKTIVIGIGNLLLRDEGFGVHAIKEFESHQVPDNVEIYDCGTGGLTIPELLDGAERGVVVDAIRKRGEPGTIYRFKMDQIRDRDKLKMMTSPHEFDLATALKMGRKVYELPDEITLIGVEPGNIEAGLGLSAEVKESLPEVIRLILEEIKA